MPFERLTKLGRTAARKAYATTWYTTWGALAAYLLAMVALYVFDDAITAWQRYLLLPWYSTFVLVALVFIAALWLLRRYRRQQMKDRADFDSEVRFKKDVGGLRFATAEIEYFIKWSGIAQVFLEPDGVVISHGNLFFLIPDRVFVSGSERNDLIRDIYAQMDDKARARSERQLRPILDAPSGRAGF